MNSRFGERESLRFQKVLDFGQAMHNGVPFVSKLRKKWVFIYPARYLYIQPGIYISSQVFIYPAGYLYKSSQVFINPPQDI